MSELARHDTPYSVVTAEPPDVLARNLRVGAHLWSSATAFFFVPFLFAFFYLRSLDKPSAFKPKHVAPSFTLGTLTILAIVVGTALIWWGYVDRAADRRPQWRRKGVVALAVLLAAVGLQIAEWATQGFGPADGGYASVYLGWTGMLVLFVLGLAFWLETTVAFSVRYGTFKQQLHPSHAAGDPDRDEPDVADPLALVVPELHAVAFFASAISVIAVITWIVLYLL